MNALCLIFGIILGVCLMWGSVLRAKRNERAANKEADAARRAHNALSDIRHIYSTNAPVMTKHTDTVLRLKEKA